MNNKKTENKNNDYISRIINNKDNKILIDEEFSRKIIRESNYFYDDYDSKKSNFISYFPPPNITGKLHIGHAYNIYLQEFYIKLNQLDNNIFWVKGIDHGGISTEIQAKKILSKQGKWDENSDKFSQIFNFSLKYEKEIKKQLDFFYVGFTKIDTVPYTLDKISKNIVRQKFNDLYKKGLIFYSKRVTPCDTTLKTALSDVQIEFKTTVKKLYYVKYQIFEKENIEKKYLLVATSRPETIWGDAVLFVNPNDKRYLLFHNKYVINPLNNKKMKILTDTEVKQDFGTGVLKCTPAHDPLDFKLAEKHSLKKESFVNVFDIEKKFIADKEIFPLEFIDLNNKSIPLVYKGKNYDSNLSFSIAILEDRKMLSKVEEYESLSPFSEKTGEIIEYILKDELYLKTSSLIKLIDKKIIDNLLISKKYINFFIEWINNAQDWCISRDINWGMKLPFENSEKKIDKVLDTWFISSLWPRIINYHLTINFKEFNPLKNSKRLLVTGYDIIFYWVIRMMFMSEKKSERFDYLLLHGLVRDDKKNKMSKTLGNGIDPIDFMNSHGHDTLRGFFLFYTKIGNDISLSIPKINRIKEIINESYNVFNNLVDELNFNLENIEFSFKNFLNVRDKLDKNLEVSEIFNFIEFKILSDFSNIRELLELNIIGKSITFWFKNLQKYFRILKIFILFIIGNFKKINLNVEIIRELKEYFFYILSLWLSYGYLFFPNLTINLISKITTNRNLYKSIISFRKNFNNFSNEKKHKHFELLDLSDLETQINKVKEKLKYTKNNKRKIKLFEITGKKVHKNTKLFLAKSKIFNVEIIESNSYSSYNNFIIVGKYIFTLILDDNNININKELLIANLKKYNFELSRANSLLINDKFLKFADKDMLSWEKMKQSNYKIIVDHLKKILHNEK